MANFIKKMIVRAKSRSMSPMKQQRYNDYERWNRKIYQEQYLQYGPPQIDTYEHFVHPKYTPQNFQEDHHWDVERVDRTQHYITSHQLDIDKELIIPRQLTANDDDSLEKQHNETFESLSIPVNNFEQQQQQHLNASSPVMSFKKKNLMRKEISRERSSSPQKATQTSFDESFMKSRSRSPNKRFHRITETFDYLSPQCQMGKCSAALIVQDSKFLVCKHQLSHVSNYFRALFSADKSVPITGACQSSCNEFAVVVSSLKNPTPTVQFRWFLESTIRSSTDITDEMLETCMRLSKRFRAKYLEMKCAKYIQDNVAKRTPVVALCWLNWVIKHKFDRITYNACLPCVAVASIQCLEEHRNLISERLLADLLAAKLRTLYDQAVSVFQTIHSMDHFYVDVDKCPTCGHQREQGKVRIQASPCRKMLGCEQCLREFGCNLSGKDHNYLQACYQCEHGLVALNDHTDDCQCQIPLLASHLRGLQSHFLPLTNPQ